MSLWDAMVERQVERARNFEQEIRLLEAYARGRKGRREKGRDRERRRLGTYDRGHDKRRERDAVTARRATIQAGRG